MRFHTHRTLPALVLAAAASLSFNASALPVFEQGFETDTSGFSGGGAYGAITRTASGTNGITSYEGNYHAAVTETSSSVYTFFDGARDSFPGSYSVQTAIYLDTSWAAGSGFDYSVASYGSDGAHQRDFIFHVAQDTSTGELLVGGSNNSNFETREDLEGLNNYSVNASGWYVFEYLFSEVSGALSVDLNLLSDVGNLLWTETRTNPADTIPAEVGGNGYGWFTHVDVGENGLAIDAVQLDIGSTEVPEPNIIALIGLGLFGLVWNRRKRQA